MQSARQLREKRNYIQRKSSDLVMHLLEDKAAADITRDLLQRESRLTISFTFVIQLIASLTLKKKRRKSVKGNPLLFARIVVVVVVVAVGRKEKEGSTPQVVCFFASTRRHTRLGR